MPLHFTPDELIAIQLALVDKLTTLEERLKTYELKKRPGYHTKALIGSTMRALDKINRLPPDEA
ncbi:hypothetical protein [Paenibacillus sp. FSL H8-0259]|uniref:hypothetical protein n=1 Tax=Paenibacillus sp. FSL H8-0259 TaxID=1920423 RepID=UPI00096CE5C5|nr:hypothetical protein [Paenibacillus sp. FSL H8-0259]OMF28326.1 hypothetical protein BK132_14825 [Paenibacillus sp. FSL H8-0259]